MFIIIQRQDDLGFEKSARALLKKANKEAKFDFDLISEKHSPPDPIFEYEFFHIRPVRMNRIENNLQIKDKDKLAI